MPPLSILALDASTESCSVALTRNALSNDSILYRETTTPRAHAQSLLPMIDAVLSEANCALNDLDYLALTHGPGSFTGIRIALSTVQGLAYSVNLPVLCVSSLDALAVHLLTEDDSPSTYLISCLNARMGEVYWAGYQCDDGGLTQLVGDAVSSLDDFHIGLQAFTERFGAFVGCGDGWALPNISSGLALQTNSTASPDARKILRYLQQHDDYHAIERDASTLEPLYLRNEIAWKKRTRIRA